MKILGFEEIMVLTFQRKKLVSILDIFGEKKSECFVLFRGFWVCVQSVEPLFLVNVILPY